MSEDMKKCNDKAHGQCPDEAKRLLRSVEKLDTQVACRLAERQQWHDLALQITASGDGVGVRSSGSHSKMADALDRCLDMEEEIDRAVAELVQTRGKVAAALELVENPTEYKLLHLRYIQHKSFWEIAEAFQADYTWVTTTHGRALASFRKILEKE